MMRQPRRRLAHVVAIGPWRRAAQVFAVLAVLANAALLPAVHFAAGGPRAGWAQLAETSGAHGHHAASRDDDGPERPGGSGHQVCHFCRLLGAALPPPPSVAVVVEFAFGSVEWPAADTAILRRQALRTANLPRAPPSRG
jgi:hypothetical protein